MVSTHDHTNINDGDYSDVSAGNSKGAVGVIQTTYITYTMKINHGILNLDKALPLHLMGQNFALNIELYLSAPTQISETIGDTTSLGVKSYQLTNVSCNMKLL